MSDINVKLTHGFATLGLICGKLRKTDPATVVMSFTTATGDTVELTCGILRDVLTLAFREGDLLQRISTWHARERGPAGMVGDYCIECETRWPCDTWKMANGEYDD